VEVENLGWWVPALVVGVPPVLLVLLTQLERVERWTLRADERAAEVVRILEQDESPDDVEVAVTTLLAEVATMPRAQRERVATAAARAVVRRRRGGAPEPDGTGVAAGTEGSEGTA